MNQEIWQFNEDQVKSAIKLLKSKEGHEVDIIPIIQEDGIDAVAFTFRGVLEDVGKEIAEVAMNSTCKLFHL